MICYEALLKNKFKLNDMVRRSRHHSHRRSSNTSHHYSRQKYYQTYMAKILVLSLQLSYFFALTFGRIIPAFLGMIVLIFLFIAALIILRGTLTKNYLHYWTDIFCNILFVRFILLAHRYYCLSPYLHQLTYSLTSYFFFLPRWI